MVEAFAVANGKGSTRKAISTLVLGMALAEKYDAIVINADTGTTNLLFHTGLDDADMTPHDLLIDDHDAVVSDTVYERFGLSVVPCGTGLAVFEAVGPGRPHDVVAGPVADTDVLLLDPPAVFGSKSVVLPIVLADRIVVVLRPTVPSPSDGLEIQEYAYSYGTDTAGVVFNRVHPGENVGTIAEQVGRYFGGQTLAPVPKSDAVRAAHHRGKSFLAHASDDPAADTFREAVARLDVCEDDGRKAAERLKNVVVPE